MTKTILASKKAQPGTAQLGGVLITGGTGSLGNALTRDLLGAAPVTDRLVIFSRDELKQHEMRIRFPPEQFPQLRFFLGDVRDSNRLMTAMDGIDVVIHAAALKQVPAAEYNPFECVKTNVIGAENVVQAALSRGVRRVVALSTDKACAPINLYGATKLCSDKLILAANNIRGNRDVSFSVVRYGNVMGSRGSVVPFFLKHRSRGFFPVTDRRMTRFNIMLQEGVDLVKYAASCSLGGELYVKKIPSFTLTDLCEAIDPSLEIREVGIRAGEKLHEEMVTVEDAMNTIENDDYYIILPSGSTQRESFLAHHNAAVVPETLRYASNTNPHFLNVAELRSLVASLSNDAEPEQ